MFAAAGVETGGGAGAGGGGAAIGAGVCAGAAAGGGVCFAQDVGPVATNIARTPAQTNGRDSFSNRLTSQPES